MKTKNVLRQNNFNSQAQNKSFLLQLPLNSFMHFFPEEVPIAGYHFDELVTMRFNAGFPRKFGFFLCNFTRCRRITRTNECCHFAYIISRRSRFSLSLVVITYFFIIIYSYIVKAYEFCWARRMWVLCMSAIQMRSIDIIQWHIPPTDGNAAVSMAVIKCTWNVYFTSYCVQRSILSTRSIDDCQSVVQRWRWWHFRYHPTVSYDWNCNIRIRFQLHSISHLIQGRITVVRTGWSIISRRNSRYISCEI